MKGIYRLKFLFVGFVTILPGFFGNFTLTRDLSGGKIISS
ncbi:MAG: hypothetical protein ANABAC_0827 [Anaerolineae bacterium]|nr:MAG: hypothetical protein ANABAC_0827 [Anaerolineae bacterium]